MATGSIDYNGQLAEVYESGRALSPEAEATWFHAIKGHVAGKSTVVDVGAGTGRFSRLLTRVAEWYVIAAEPAARMRSIGAEISGDLDVSWVGARAEYLPFGPGSVDVIWTAFATHYFDLPSAGEEFARVLAPKGRLLIWHAYDEVQQQLEWYRWFPSAYENDKGRIQTAVAVSEILRDQGLELLESATHQMFMAADLDALADRLEHRSISTLRLIDDAEFEKGIKDIREHARTVPSAPIYSPNMLLVFGRQS